MHVFRGVQHLEIQQQKQHCHHITGTETGTTPSLEQGDLSPSLSVLGNTGMLHPILMGPIPCIQKPSRPNNPPKRLGLSGCASAQLSGPEHLPVYGAQAVHRNRLDCHLHKHTGWCQDWVSPVWDACLACLLAALHTSPALRTKPIPTRSLKQHTQWRIPQTGQFPSPRK